MLLYVVAICLALDSFHNDIGRCRLAEIVVYRGGANDAWVGISVYELLGHCFRFGDTFAILDPDEFVVCETILLRPHLFAECDDICVRW